MNEVCFPGLGISLTVNKIAVNLFGINITWYAILIVASVVIALAIYRIKNNLYEIKFDTILEMFIWVLPISIVCARIYYVAFSLDYFLQNPLQILNIKNGGLAIYGGIIGGVITCYIFCKKKKINLLDTLDYIVPGLALGQAIGRWGNFINVEAYGEETTNFLRMGIWENGIYKEVHPTFLYESVITLLLFILLIIFQNKRKFKGQITYLYLIVYSLARSFIEGLRTDSLMLGNFRISQILSIAIFVTFCFILYKNVQNEKKKPQSGVK